LGTWQFPYVITSSAGEKVNKWKKGFYHIAQKTQIPVYSGIMDNITIAYIHSHSTTA
jgi:1-acyl-sn-glycerol-3-phosphate acyltransferase